MENKVKDDNLQADKCPVYSLVSRMRGLEIDHPPDGWPAVQMEEISSLCNLIEKLCLEVLVSRADSERLKFVYNGKTPATDALLKLELRIINGSCPSIDEVRIAIDEAMAC